MPVLAEATDGTWQIELVEEAPDGPWELKVRNLRRFGEVFGRPVLSAFCRCFVHVDRLNSLISCMHTSQQFHGRDSVAFARDLNTLVWFTVGTLRELARAIQGLRTALATRGRLDAESAPWVALRDLERRWENDADYRRMRNQVAFHVDPEVIERGLNVLVEDEDDVTLAEGRGRRHVDSRLSLGMLSLHNGLELDLEGYGEFLEAVMEGHMAAGKDIQDAFRLGREGHHLTQHREGEELVPALPTVATSTSLFGLLTTPCTVDAGILGAEAESALPRRGFRPPRSSSRRW